jgi:hypothetical protein
MLGQIEPKPEEGPDDSPGFAGSRKIVSTESVQERLLEDSKHRIVSRDYLAARLVDFLIGDTDRGADQWRWARFTDPSGGYLWRPIPRDRDWAYFDAEGFGYRVAHWFFKKLVRFGEDLPSLGALIASSTKLDRQFLADLDRTAWDSITSNVVAAVTDSVISSALRAQPPEYQAIATNELQRKLSARLNDLPGRSAEFYAKLAEDVDVHATDGEDIADVRRFPDGSVAVRLYAGRGVSTPITADNGDNGNGRPYYERRFLLSETREIRVYLHGGADQAHIAGTTERSIGVRIIGGAGPDRLIDASRVDDGRWWHLDLVL